MQKILNNCVINECGQCGHYIEYGDLDIVSECGNMTMQDGNFPEVDPDKIHPECELKDVEVFEVDNKNIDKIEVRIIKKPRHVCMIAPPPDVAGYTIILPSDDIEKILIIRKGE